MDKKTEKLTSDGIQYTGEEFIGEDDWSVKTTFTTDSLDPIDISYDVGQFSFDYDGADELMELNNQSFGLNSAVSVSAWVKVPLGEGASDFNFRFVVSEDRLSGNLRNWSIFWRGGMHQVFAYVRDSGNVNLNAIATFTMGDGD